MIEEYIELVHVNIQGKSFTLVGSEGDTKKIMCENGDQFMRVLEVCKDHLEESQIKWG